MRKPGHLSGRISQTVKPTSRLDVLVFSTILFSIGFFFFLIYANFGITKKAFASLGMHGAKTVSTTNVILNEFTTLTANASVGATSITVASSSLNANSRFSGNLAAGELIMIIQMQGATMNTASATSSAWGTITAYNNAGKYEFDEVASVPNATTINLVSSLVNSYTSTGKVQVIRVPRYTSLTVNAGASLTTQAWNGSTGGVLAIEADWSAIINGTIDASGMGFRGGTVDSAANSNHTIYASTVDDDGAEKGEGIAGNQTSYDVLGGRYGRGAPANGGGGGNAHNCGGGGGANGDNSITYNGMGIPDTTTDSNWKTAWDLEGSSFHKNVTSGGGRGGYSYNMKNKDPLTTAPGNTTWNGDDRSNVGGWGGRPLTNSGNVLFMGGGGGAGDSNNNTGTGGANGGGIIYMLVGGTVSGSGNVNADGSNGTNSTANDAAGGGGGGGSVVFYVRGSSISGLTINANGGKGGSQQRIANSSGEAEGPGGGGGGGYISVTSPNSLICKVNGGANGTTNSPTMVTFLPNGATFGASGHVVSNPQNPYSGSVPLPLTLKKFSGETRKNTIELTWITVSEINNDYFTVERSSDGYNFYPIGKKNGSGNSSTENTYKLTDDNPLIGENFYRLSQTDFNGTTEKFEPILIHFDAQVQGLAIQYAGPNPFKDFLVTSYNSEEAGVVEIQLRNPMSQLIWSEQIAAGKGINSFYFSDFASLRKGVYFIQLLEGNNKSQPLKVIKD